MCPMCWTVVAALTTLGFLGVTAVVLLTDWRGLLLTIGVGSLAAVHLLRVYRVPNWLFTVAIVSTLAATVWLIATKHRRRAEAVVAWAKAKAKARCPSNVQRTALKREEVG